MGLKDDGLLQPAFGEIYQSLRAEVYKFIYYKVQNKEEAEELTQEVFRKVLQQLHNHPIDEDKMRSYVFAAARNTLYDTWRKRRNIPLTLPLDELQGSLSSHSDEYKVVEDSLLVQDALNQLLLVEKEILIMRIIEGYPVKKVAKQMGKPPGTIKSLQYRALKKLREYLLKGGYFDE